MKRRDENLEKQAIEQSLKEAHFNRKKTAELLGIDCTTLWRKMKKFGIKI